MNRPGPGQADITEQISPAAGPDRDQAQYIVPELLGRTIDRWIDSYNRQVTGQIVLRSRRYRGGHRRRRAT